MLSQALRMLAFAIKRNAGLYQKYEGSSEEICKAITKNCFNHRYFSASAGHFNDFYIRDFAYCIKALLHMGYEKEVESTLRYALAKYRQNGWVTTTITCKGEPKDFFSPTPESTALLLYSLDKAEMDISEHKDILENSAKISYTFFDRQSSLLRKYVRLSSIKDNAIRQSSCYNNSMLFMLSSYLDRYRLKNPFDTKNIKKAIMTELYNGEFFFDDLQKKSYIAADANIFPFWCGVVDDKDRFKNILKLILKDSLENPYPIRYTKEPQGKFIFPHKYLAPNYEGDTIWLHLGLIFVEIVKKYEPQEAEKYITALRGLVNKHKNFPEVLNPDGTLYKKPLYCSDESMLWASMLVWLIEC